MDDSLFAFYSLPEDVLQENAFTAAAVEAFSPELSKPEFYTLDMLSNETFFSRNEDVRNIIKNIKKVTPEEFKKIAKEGDAVTVSRTVTGGFKSAMNRLIQGQSFTSLKMIGPGCKTVIGFGVTLAENGGGTISEISYEEFTKTCTAMVLCRPKHITDAQRHKAYLFMKYLQQKKQSYMSVYENILSVIRHWWNYGSSATKKEMSKDEIKNYSGSLLCSSVVANAYRYAGVDNGFHSTKEYDVWPSDFLTTSTYEHPAAYFAEGEYVSTESITEKVDSDIIDSKSTHHYKTISFPEEEIDTLKSQSKIITTRVSRDFNRLQLHDIVKTPWDVLYEIVKRTVIHDIKDHPYYSELTDDQIKFLEKYDEIAVLELKKCESEDVIKKHDETEIVK